jgi:hypothetical protein
MRSSGIYERYTEGIGRDLIFVPEPIFYNPSFNITTRLYWVRLFLLIYPALQGKSYRWTSIFILALLPVLDH